MKNSISSISPVVTRPSSPVAPSGRTQIYSEVSSSSGVKSSSEVNISKVAAMKAAIENGTFKINPEAIIQGMVNKGDLVIGSKA